jgi:N-acetylmuramoyl-L-alanine amidase
VFKRGIYLIAVLFLAGCAGNSIHRLPPSEPAASGAPHEFPTLPATPIPPSHAPRPAPPTSVPLATWTSLAGWATQRGLAAPQRLSDVPVAAYSVTSKYGTVVLEIGSREAAWNGVQINLGFAPQMIDGEISLYGLDLQKNLQPLLCEPPITFPKNGVIVIDPGHGGSNVGTHSVVDGRFEKEFTLDVAQRLKPLLEAEGWKVWLTRASDVYVTNANRVVFAKARHADLFVSLHFNSAAPEEKPVGLETYCYTPTGMPSTVTRNYSDPWTEKLSSNDFDAQNLKLAVKMQGALTRIMDLEDRGVRHVRYIEVLRGQKCPAILIENGYLSNPAEAKLIESPTFRQKLAEAIAAALKPAGSQNKSETWPAK